MGTTEIKKVNIDFEVLDAVLTEKKITKKELAARMGRGATYFADLKKRGAKVPAGVENFICLELGVDAGTFVKQEQEKQVPGSQSEVGGIVLGNIYKSLNAHEKSLNIMSGSMEQTAELLEKIWNKLTAQSEQMARMRDMLKELTKSDREKAEEFLRNVLVAEKALEEDIIRESQKKGIKQADLMAAKRDMDVQISTTGYGKNQKKWWLLSR